MQCAEYYVPACDWSLLMIYAHQSTDPWMTLRETCFLYFAANLLKYNTNSTHYFALECQTFGGYLILFVMVDLILPIFILKPLGYLQRFLLILVSPAHVLSQERLKGSFASGVSPNPSKPANPVKRKITHFATLFKKRSYYPLFQYILN